MNSLAQVKVAMLRKNWYLFWSNLRDCIFVNILCHFQIFTVKRSFKTWMQRRFLGWRSQDPTLFTGLLDENTKQWRFWLHFLHYGLLISCKTLLMINLFVTQERGTVFYLLSRLNLMKLTLISLIIKLKMLWTHQQWQCG